MRIRQIVLTMTGAFRTDARHGIRLFRHRNRNEGNIPRPFMIFQSGKEGRGGLLLFGFVLSRKFERPLFPDRHQLDGVRRIPVVSRSEVTEKPPHRPVGTRAQRTQKIQGILRVRGPVRSTTAAGNVDEPELRSRFRPSAGTGRDIFGTPFVLNGRRDPRRHRRQADFQPRKGAVLRELRHRPPRAFDRAREIVGHQRPFREEIPYFLTPSEHDHHAQGRPDFQPRIRTLIRVFRYDQGLRKS